MSGLSLFSLLAHTNAPQGYAILRQWFLSPLQSVDAIVERQDIIAFFKENSMAEQAHQLRTALRKMGDVHSGLNAIRRGGIRYFEKF
jgi:DNA mismatch repair protein MSH5